MSPKSKMDSPWYPPSIISSSDGDRFEWQEGAHYKCVEHESYDCECVRRLYVSAEDASIIFDMIREAQRTKFGDFCIFVPISFQPMMEVVVSLDPLENLEGTALVYLEQATIPDDMWSCWHSETKWTGEPSQSVGMIAPGDSATTIVSMLDNHLVTLKDIDVAECPAAIHSFSQQMYLMGNLKTNPARRLEKWSRLLYGMCIACKTDPQAINFDDLVPQKEGRPF